MTIIYIYIWPSLNTELQFFHSNLPPKKKKNGFPHRLSVAFRNSLHGGADVRTYGQ